MVVVEGVPRPYPSSEVGMWSNNGVEFRDCIQRTEKTPNRGEKAAQ